MVPKYAGDLFILSTSVLRVLIYRIVPSLPLCFAAEQGECQTFMLDVLEVRLPRPTIALWRPPPYQLRRGLAERYGWTDRALPAGALDKFVKSLARRIATFPVAGQLAVKDRINAITLAPVEDFCRDSYLFGEVCVHPKLKARCRPR
jgi:hypothetical protein